MNARRLLAPLVLALAMVGCPCQREPLPPPSGTDCAAACARLAALDCQPECSHEDAARHGLPASSCPSPAGEVCADLAAPAGRRGWLCEAHVRPGRTACIAAAETCEAARACKGSP